MQENYNDKMVSFAERMRSLILEAYAEGIVLSADDPNTAIAVDDPEVKQHRTIVMVPLTNHFHPILDKPLSVMAFALHKNGEIIPSNKLEPLAASVKIEVRHSSKSVNLFVPIEDLAPWRTSDGKYYTSAFKFGTKFDLLGLTTYDDDHLVDVTDCLEPDICLDKIFYRNADGQTQEAVVHNMPKSQAVNADYGNAGDMVIDTAITVSPDGLPTSSPTGNANILIQGKINLQFGTVEMVAMSDVASIVPLGYTLNISRSNPNRRPRYEASELHFRTKSA